MNLISLSVQLPGEDDGCREPGLAAAGWSCRDERGHRIPPRPLTATAHAGSRETQKQKPPETERADSCRLQWPGCLGPARPSEARRQQRGD